jgi:uncharacterized protein (DUF2225 family)
MPNKKPSERIAEIFRDLDKHDPYRQLVIERRLKAIETYLDEQAAIETIKVQEPV